MPSLAEDQDPGEEYLLRWRLDYADGTVLRGLWSAAGEAMEHSCSKQPRSGLLRASIEGRKIRAGSHIRKIAEYDGEDFIEFQFLVTQCLATVNSGGAVRMTSRPVQRIFGARLVGRRDSLTVLNDGSTVYERRKA